MLIAIDVGNTQTVMGLFDGEELLDQWRLSTVYDRTADEYRLFFEGLLRQDHWKVEDCHGVALSSVVPTVKEAMLVFGGASFMRRGGWWPAYERLIDASWRQRGYGDYFGYTFVARGQAEAMIDVDLKPWDLASLKVIIEEAGGRFTDFAGEPTIYGGTAVASNGLVHEEILNLIAGR